MSRYIALLRDTGIEREVRTWLEGFREDLWRLCSSPSGLCRLEDVDKALASLLRTYNSFVRDTGYDIESKRTAYNIVKTVVEEIVRYIGSGAPGYRAPEEVTRPEVYRVEVSVRGRVPRETGELLVEVYGQDTVVSRHSMSGLSETIELPVGTYLLRALAGGREVYRATLRIPENRYVVIDVGRGEEGTRVRPGRTRRYTGHRVFSKTGVEGLRSLLRPLDMNIVGIALLVILLVLDLLIFLL